MKNKINIKLKLYFEFFLFYIFYIISNLLPINLVSFSGGIIFRIIGPYTKTHKIVKKNIQQIYPSANYNDVKKIFFRKLVQYRKNFF